MLTLSAPPITQAPQSPPCTRSGVGCGLTLFGRTTVPSAPNILFGRRLWILQTEHCPCFFLGDNLLMDEHSYLRSRRRSNSRNRMGNIWSCHYDLMIVITAM